MRRGAKPRDFVVRAWGPEIAAKIMDRRHTGFASPDYIDELRASLRMTNAMVERHVNWITGRRPPIVTWMPRK